MYYVCYIVSVFGLDTLVSILSDSVNRLFISFIFFVFEFFKSCSTTCSTSQVMVIIRASHFLLWIQCFFLRSFLTFIMIQQMIPQSSSDWNSNYDRYDFLKLFNIHLSFIMINKYAYDTHDITIMIILSI